MKLKKKHTKKKNKKTQNKQLVHSMWDDRFLLVIHTFVC